MMARDQLSAALQGKSAAAWVTAAAKCGFAEAQVRRMLLEGNGVARDRDAAFACYAKAAAKSHVRAMNFLGRCYEEGWGVARDPDTARDWYRRSALGGYFRGAYNYADMIAAEGCIHSALPWFKCALDAAPEPTRNAILKSLAAKSHPAFRALAASYTSSRSSGRATSA